MQQTLNTKVPTPQNISKWSLGRKEVLAKNEYLMKQLDSKSSLIRDLKTEITELKFKITLNGLELPQNLSDSKTIYFDYSFISNDGDCLTYYVTNDELDVNKEVEIPISELIEHFDDSEITQDELDSFISDYLTESISY